MSSMMMYALIILAACDMAIDVDAESGESELNPALTM